RHRLRGNKSPMAPIHRCLAGSRPSPGQAYSEGDGARRDWNSAASGCNPVLSRSWDAALRLGARCIFQRQFARFQELAQDDAAFQSRQMIDEEHAIEVVDLMLEASGQQS